MRDLRRETGGLLNLRGDWLRDYAIANLIGATVLMMGSLSTRSFALSFALVVLGGAFQFIAVPISGIVVFGELLMRSAQAARPRTTTLPAAGPLGPMGVPSPQNQFPWRPGVPWVPAGTDPEPPPPEVASESAALRPPEPRPIPPPPEDSQ